MKSKIIIAVITVLFALPSFAQIFSNSLDKIPSDWKAGIFKLSYDYPTTLPTEKNQPWLKYQFDKQPKQYMNAVLRYFIEGNEKAHWEVQNNKIRKWYHAPSMVWGNNGREFIHGLTRERTSPAGELYPTQDSKVQNWAVGFYNPIGAFTFGKVWSDTNDLKLENVSFPEGTVTAKLLFTAATPKVVPYLEGSLEWTANINVEGTIERKPQSVYLLQVDIAVKDSVWVFGTFVYNVNAKGSTVWEKLVPVGLMWGNDPEKLFNNEPLAETWINPEFASFFRFPNGETMHLGYKGRLNGPVDNPISSCLSCHSTALIGANNQQFRRLTPNVNDAADITKFFRNLKSSETFDGLPTSFTMDYSLQLANGVAAALTNRSRRAAEFLAGTKSRTTADFKNVGYFLTSRDDPASFNSEEPSNSTAVKSNDTQQSVGESIGSKILWVVGALLVLIFAFRKFSNRKK